MRIRSAMVPRKVAKRLSDNGLLYAKVKKDAILIYALQHHYDLYQTNELLLAHGFEILD